MSYVEIRDLCFVYFSAKTAVFDNLTFSLSKGEIVGILGESGSGKSTLLRLIAGLETPSAGKIRIADRIVVDEQTFVAPEQRGVGMVFQDYALFPHLTVAQNIAFGLHRLSRAARKSRVREMIELVKLAGLEERYPHELSGGQQQRVAVARALAPKPDILLMDEPFSNLDAALKSEIREELRLILKTAGITCLFVSHDQADIEAICDRSIRIGSVMVR